MATSRSSASWIRASFSARSAIVRRCPSQPISPTSSTPSSDAACRASRSAASPGSTPARPRPMSTSITIRTRLPAAANGGRERPQLVGVVDGDDRIRAAAQLDQPRQLVRPDDRVGDEQIADAGGCHQLGLAELRAGQPDRAGSDLARADRAGAVALDVRPPRDSGRAAGRRDAADVLLHHVEVEAERGRVEIVSAAARGGRCCPATVRDRSVMSCTLASARGGLSRSRVFSGRERAAADRFPGDPRSMALPLARFRGGLEPGGAARRRHAELRLQSRRRARADAVAAATPRRPATTSRVSRRP